MSDQKKSSKKSLKKQKSEDTLPEVEKEREEDLPAYPPREKKGESILGTSEEEFTEFEDEEEEHELKPEDIEEICGDVYGGLYEIWRVFNPRVRSINEKEKKQVKRILSRIVIDRDLVKYAKNEFLLFFYVSVHVGNRLKELKSDKDHSREEREREDTVSQESD